MASAFAISGINPNKTYVSFYPAKMGRSRTFATLTAACEALEKAGWKFMRRRYVRVHGYTEFFFGKSVARYNASKEYACACIDGDRRGKGTK